MADRYDDYERSHQGRRGNGSENLEGGFDRENWEDQSRNRGGREQQERSGREQSGAYERRDQPQRGPDWIGNRTEWGRERTGHEGPYGTGSQGFGTGYRSAEFSSRSTGLGPHGGYGPYGVETSQGSGGTQDRQGGRFAGKGPKGYRRSDERILEDVCERLTHHPEVDASEIEVKVNQGEVTLTGTVPERHAKRLAEEAAESVSGVRDVHNQVRVRDREMAGVSNGGDGGNRGL